MLQAITSLFKKKPFELPAQLLYTKMIGQARMPYFYSELDVCDNIDGRFDMIGLHLYLILDRLENEPSASELTQHLVNYMISDIDRNFREMGVGDMSVGKKVQKLATALYGRLEAYQIAGDKINADGGAAFEKALCRNVYRKEEAGNLPLADLRKYVVGQKELLAKQPLEIFLSGDVNFQKFGEIA